MLLTYPIEITSRDNPSTEVWIGGAVAVIGLGLAAWWFLSPAASAIPVVPEALAALPKAALAPVQKALSLEPVQVDPKWKSRVGEAVHVKWGWDGKWYPATILSFDADKGYFVHYKGYSSSFDEYVSADKVM